MAHWQLLVDTVPAGCDRRIHEMLARNFNPAEPRDPHSGKWMGGGGAVHDVLKLAGRIKLGESEHLAGSDVLSAAPSASSPNKLTLAMLRTPDGPKLRMGMVDRDDANKWAAANKGGTVELNYLSMVELTSELDTAAAKGTQQSAVWRKEQADYQKLQDRLHEIHTTRDPKTAKLTHAAEAEAEKIVKQIENFNGTVGPDDIVHENVVHGGQWGDVLIQTHLREETASGAFQVIMYRRPPGAGPDWIPSDQDAGVEFAMTATGVRKFLAKMTALQAMAKGS